MREAFVSSAMISKSSLTLALSQKERELNPGRIRVGFVWLNSITNSHQLSMSFSHNIPDSSAPARE
jgi:hypothetical protein